MAYRTFVARSPDGFLLCEAHGEAPAASLVCAAEQARTQAQQLLARLHGMPPSSSVRCAGGFVAHLRICDGVCYLGLFCPNYPQNAAFTYIEDVRAQFQEELKREFGTGSVDYRSHIETIEKPYYFCRFDRHIARTLTQYRDPSSSTVLGKLQADLCQVSHIMKCNIDELVMRGDLLEDVSHKASLLNVASQQFASTTRTLSLEAMLQKYAVPLVVILATVLLVFLFLESDSRFSVACCAAAFLCAVFAVRGRLAGQPARGEASGDKFSFAAEYHADHLHVL